MMRTASAASGGGEPPPPPRRPSKSLRERPRAMAAFPANPCQQLFHVGLHPLLLISARHPHSSSAAASSRSGATKPASPSQLAESLFEFRLPSRGGPCAGSLHRPRPPAGPRRDRNCKAISSSDFISAASSAIEFANLACFRENPASAHQKRNSPGGLEPRLEQYLSRPVSVPG